MTSPDHTTENERALAARRALRDEATARMIERPCPDLCGHGHLTSEQIAGWGLWSILRKTGRMGKEHVTAALEALADPLPEPEVAARPATFDETPASARALYKLAQEHGWYGSITYSRGPATHATTGKFLRMVDSICVRLARQVDIRSMQRVTASWLDGKFAKATVWGAGEPARVLDSEPIKAHIRTPITERNRP